jgi:hypothetical protein
MERSVPDEGAATPGAAELAAKAAVPALARLAQLAD